MTSFPRVPFSAFLSRVTRSATFCFLGADPDCRAHRLAWPQVGVLVVVVVAVVGVGVVVVVVAGFLVVWWCCCWFFGGRRRGRRLR